jgi:hypothetical protein
MKEGGIEADEYRLQELLTQDSTGMKEGGIETDELIQTSRAVIEQTLATVASCDGKQHRNKTSTVLPTWLKKVNTDC